MGDTHAARAEALAAEAEAIMRKEMDLENKGHTNAGIGGNKWQRVQALQAQAPGARDTRTR